MKDFNIHSNKNYTIMSNYHFQERNMSLKAKGLLSLMLSLPENWDYSIRGLTTLSKDGRDAVMGALQELEEFGYLVRTTLRGSDGKFKGYLYDIYEEPQKKPYSENPNSVIPNSENPTQYNTKIINNEKNKNDKLINDKSRESRACEDESSMLLKEDTPDYDDFKKICNEVNSYNSTYDAIHKKRKILEDAKLNEFIYDKLHRLVQRLYYEKIFTAEECIVLSDLLKELDQEHDYWTVAKAFSYSLDKSKSKKIKSRVAYLTRIIPKNINVVERIESGSNEAINLEEIINNLVKNKNETTKLQTS